MSKRNSSIRIWPVWVAISAVIIIAGIILASILGFNAAQNGKTLDVVYDASVESAKVQEICEKALDAKSLSYTVSVGEEIGTGETTSTGFRRVTCTVRSDVKISDLETVAESVRSSLKAQFAEAEISVSAHESESLALNEACWRGAVALAVGAVVALIYVGVRFGVGKALAGLIVCLNGALCTFGVLAISRIALAAYVPMLLIAVGAALSLLFWIVMSAKMREDFKDPSFAGLSAEEAIGESVRNSKKLVLAVALVLAVVLAALAVAMQLVLLTVLIPVVVSVYSSLLLAPAIYAPIKAKFDRFTSKRKRYVGKQKGVAEEE